jgi:S-adenosylmethionine synthetase
VCKEIGYDDDSKGLDYKTMTVLVNVVPQSQEIFDAVHKRSKNLDDFGAGDQGLMFGYATDEWD